MHGGESVADGVGGRPVLILACVGALGDQRFDLGVCGIGLLGRFFLFFEKIQREHLVELTEHKALGGVVGVRLQHVVDHRQTERSVEVVVHRLFEFGEQRVCFILFGLSVLAE